MGASSNLGLRGEFPVTGGSDEDFKQFGDQRGAFQHFRDQSWGPAIWGLDGGPVIFVLLRSWWMIVVFLNVTYKRRELFN